MLASLARYEPDLLGVYRDENIWCSSLLEYLRIADQRRVAAHTAPAQAPSIGPLPPLVCCLARRPSNTARPPRRASARCWESRNIQRPAWSECTTGFSSAPFSFVATQSFSFLSKSTAQSLLQRQFNRMSNAGDFAVSQAAELKDALDALTSNEFVMGDHHFSLQVLADVADSGGRRERQSPKPQ